MTAIAAADTPYAGIVDAPDPVAELVHLWRDVDALAGLTVAGRASGNRALEAAELIARVRHVADALLAPYAARLEELSDVEDFARYKGCPNAAALLSKHTGLSTTEAGKLIGLGRAVNRQVIVEPEPQPAWESAPPHPPEAAGGEAPRDLLGGVDPSPVLGPVHVQGAPTASAPRVVLSPLAAAIRAGLGTEKANQIQRTLDDMKTGREAAEELLVARAPKLTIVQLRRLCLETFAELDPDGYVDREARQRRNRFVRFGEEPDGMVTIFGKLDPASAAPIKAWFEAEVDAEVFGQRKLAPAEQRTMGQIGADVLVIMAQHLSGCTKASSRPKTTMVIHASRDSVETSTGFATVDGIEAPISIANALLMAVDLEFAPLLTGANGVPLKFGRAIRSATREQRQVAMHRDKGCAQCHRALSRCNAHHIIEWEWGGLTDQDNLVMLCIGCHHRLHEQGWGIQVENNQVWFIPPANVDPRRRRQPGSSARL